ncbi:MAG: M15 family metallopeptidase [Coriobacteriales bacterium]|nr:M15 family metallopeptidase [Coriobacteriales bacterium]
MVIRVNVDLDTVDYEVVSPASDVSVINTLVSKHYSLPYEYEPADLAYYGELRIKSEAIGPLEQLIADASAEGVDLLPTSGYRSAATQETLYDGYVASFGLEVAEAQSARPGFSEHQTGWAIDFSPTNYLFYDTPQAYWLAENAYRYGFIVRYTAENTDMTLYIHEPWHIRYVGSQVSNYLHDNNIASFEEYWVKYVQHTPPPLG